MHTIDGRVKVSTLDNGLRVVTEFMPHVATAAIGIWVGAGARHEHAREHGLSHLLEHMAFKGTHTRDACTIAEVIETVGGDLNAETGVEHTSYTVRLMGTDVPLGIEILADILINSRFDEDELEREKNVILQEIGAVDDTPDDLATDLFLETAFKGQAIGRSILGTPESVAGFSREAIIAYLARNYRAPQMVLSAVGAVNHDDVVAHAKRLLSSFSAEPSSMPAPAIYSGGEMHLDRDLEQTHLLIGYKGLPFLDDAVYAMQVFANLLGGGMSSRLFQEVREKRGLAYSVDAFHWGFADTGLFGMAAGTAPEDVNKLVPVLLDCLKEAAHNVTEAEINRARAQLKVSHLSALEAPMARADQLARQLLSLGRILPLEEVIAKLDAIKLNDARFVGKMLMAAEPTFVAIGPDTSLFKQSGGILHLK